MLEITDMARGEIVALLSRAGYGHLGCARDGRPYVVPMNFAFDGDSLYFYTTEGTKTELINANHAICFQVEEVTDARRWLSAVVSGRAERLTCDEDVERATLLIAARHPTFAPALAHTRIGAWKRLTRVALFRVRPSELTGRKTA